MTGWGGEEPPDSEAQLEAANVVWQFNLLRTLIRARARAIPETVRLLHASAMLQIDPTAGSYRIADTVITGSRHEPPPHGEVPRLVDEMCADITGRTNPVDAAAFALWRLNWIHPFPDGNGRTARALCCLVLFRPQGRLPPGSVSLPERIRREPIKYRRCLEEADRAWKKGRVNVTHMSGFLERLIREQLADAP